MKQLLQRDDNYRWNLDGIKFPIKERIGAPSDLIGRVEELEYLYGWINRIPRGLSKSTAFLGRRKVGKSLILERLYNIVYSEQKGIIPFYYEFSEGRRKGKEFYSDFIIRFYMQVVGYYTRDISWIRGAVLRERKITDIETIIEKVMPLSFQNKKIVLDKLESSLGMLKRDYPQYEYVLSAVAVPAGFATTPNVTDRVVQMIDEFQYLNMHIDAGEEDKPCKAYMSTAERREAPLLITGSLMGVVSEELMRWLPQRFSNFFVPKMKAEEAREMTLNYGQLYGYDITPGIAEYVVYVTNGVPGRIVELLPPKMGKPPINSIDDVDTALEYEVSLRGTIKYDWDEYLSMAMKRLNDVNMRRITYFLCRNEGTWYYPSALKTAMSLDIDDQQLRKELDILFKYDIIDMDSGRYGGVFDRTLKKVLMKNYGELFNLPQDEFDSYFKNDNMLDYLKERTERLALSLAEARQVRAKLQTLQGEHNHLKGHYYEREQLLWLIKSIMDKDGGLVDGIEVADFTHTLNYHLATGEEIDILLEGNDIAIMAECKNYAPDNIDRITIKMVDTFVAKANQLHQTQFASKELRLAFFSKHGFEQKLQSYLQQQGISF
ncbi:hypothetical protein QUF63_13335 [Anaerolineales bacterium HSG25]|nr:hypothetical protein [Anaerolineales bacterium HSG25]